jgi:hypothetical protein
MNVYDKKVAEFTRDVTPPAPREEVWHTFEDYTAKTLYFHKGVFLKAGTSWGGNDLASAIKRATESAQEAAEHYKIDKDSTLQIIAVGATYHYDLRLVRLANPDDRWDRNHYDDRPYRPNRRLVEGPMVGWSSHPDLTELPSKLIERFENL